MPSTITTSQNAQNVVQLGGGKAWLRAADTTGAVSGGDTFGILPYLKSSTIKDNTDLKKYETEEGIFLYANGAREVTVELTFLDRSVDALSLAPSVMRGNYYSMLKQVSVGKVGSYYQYAYFPVLFATSSMEFTTQGNEVKVTFNCLRVPASVTNANWTGVSNTASSMVTTSSITVDPTTYTRTNVGGFYTWYEALS